ncbi:MAG: multicopper oxidase domain-containing protein [Anaeromyxobacter sp.]|nr:multicopper oxidase domain-containing protein [Anaeromyxobacter sp.]
MPAFDPRHDYLTGAPDLSDSGGYGRVPPGSLTGLKEGPQIGFGPNTRTVMQVNVANVAAAPAFDLAALEAAFAPAPGKAGVFETAQDGIIVGQDAYNGIYTGVTFPQVWPYWGFSRIQDVTLPVFTVGGTYQSFPMEPKGIHDEMGASFDMEFGRMAGNLGMTNPNPIVGLLNLTLYDYTDPATEILNNAITPLSPVLGDGTQIWKISHNGVDMHPIHFHIFDVQVVNRVGWDGQIRAPHPTELGWKDTVRISPLEDTIVAMRPWAPKLPFSVPNSLRPLNPAIPLNSPFGFTSIDPVTQQAKVPPDVNVVTNFGWEYVWHCHILSHEENDMMRPIILNVVSTLPGTPAPLTITANAQGLPVLSWTDATPVDYVGQVNFGNPASEIAFRIERSPGIALPYVTVGFAIANATTFTDTTYVLGSHDHYRVVAYNEGGAAVSNPVEFGPPEVVPPATGVTLTANPPLQYVRIIPAVPVVFTAAATGGGLAGVGPYEYRFSIDRGVGFQVVQQYSASATYSMPVTEPGGTFDVRVDVRTGSVNDVDVSATIVGYQIIDPAVASVTLSADPLLPSPGFFGTAVTFTAVGAGSAGYQYRFWLGTGATFPATPAQDWSPTATWILPATTQPGTYQVKVDVRTSTSRVDASATVAYVVVYRPATTLAITSNRTSPHPVNIVPVPVSFLATGGGSVGTPSLAYQYRFLLSSDNVNFTEVQPFGLARTWTLPTTTALGTWYVRAQTRTSSLVAFDREATTSITLVTPPPATGVTLTSSLASPQLPGVPVTFTAAGVGSSGYQYRFWLFSSPGVWAVVQDWNVLNTWTLPTTTVSGSYQVSVEVRTTVGAVDALSLVLPFVISQATSVTISASLPSPQPAGTAIIFTASATGSTGYQYRFWMQDPAGLWTLVQDWSGLTSWTLPGTAIEGSYAVAAEARTALSGPRDAVSPNFSYTIGFLPATGVTLGTDLPSPQLPGTAVTFTAAGSGSAGYQYRFWINSGAGYSLAQDWSPTSNWVLASTTPAGTYQVVAEVRTTSLVFRDAVSPIVTIVLGAPPATGVTLTASLPSPQLPGTPITFTATGAGSVGYDYRFWHFSGGAWAIAQNWGGGATWAWTNPVDGEHRFAVEVRTTTTVARDAISAVMGYVIATPAATVATLTASLASPQVPGTAVVFTAGAGAVAVFDSRFWINNGSGWTLAQNWGGGNTWTWTNSLSGQYQVSVEVRTSPTVFRDAISNAMSFTMAYGAATSVGLGVDLPSPHSQATGLPVSFTATGAGSGNYSYRFWIHNGAMWSIAQDWNANATWVMPATMPVGSYIVAAEVRTNATVYRDAISPLMPYVVTP